MIALSLGPLALPAGPLVFLFATFLAIQLARRVARRPQAASGSEPQAADPGGTLLHATYIGLAVARLAHVGLHLQAYGAEPWAAIDLRDGGWHLSSGVAAGFGWVVMQALRHRPSWRSLVAGAAVGLATWAAGAAWLSSRAPQQLPDVVLSKLADSAPVKLGEIAGRRPVVLNLWASWCGPCRQEMPVLAAARHRHPGVLFVFVNQGESPAAVRAYLDANGLDLDVVLLDADSRLGPAVGSPGLPTTVIYDAEGRRVDAHLGALNAAALAAKLESVTLRSAN